MSEGGQSFLIDDSLMNSLTELTSDTIVDVRIGAARLVGLICGMFHADISNVEVLNSHWFPPVQIDSFMLPNRLSRRISKSSDDIFVVMLHTR